MGQIQLLPDEVVSLVARTFTLDIVQNTNHFDAGNLLFARIQEKDERWFVHVLTIFAFYYIRQSLILI